MRHPYSTQTRMAEGRHRGGGPGGSRGQERDVPSAEGLEGWLTGRLPDEWPAADISVDRDEITIVVNVDAPEAGGDATDQAAAEAGRITRWREDTREARIRIAREAEHRYGRKVAWGAQSGNSRQLFTVLSVPVMTRLRQPERQVLDTLVDSGVARSRSEALAWCVKLVGQHADTWLAELRQAMEAVEEVRTKGPGL